MAANVTQICPSIVSVHLKINTSRKPQRRKLGTLAQVDTMIVQAIGLLDDLDKELNTYSMRVREWFGWHFPEMTRIVTDNIIYAKTVSPWHLIRHISSSLISKWACCDMVCLPLSG